MLRSATRLCTTVFVLALLSTGCQEKSIEVDVNQGMTTADLLKQDLQMVVDNGQMGSEMGSIENNIAIIRQTDAAKADELTADLQELQSMGSGPAVSDKAKSMIDKL